MRIVLATGTGIDLLTILGIPIKLPYIVSILTSVIASRGANFTHDLLELLKVSRLKIKYLEVLG